MNAIVQFADIETSIPMECLWCEICGAEPSVFCNGKIGDCRERTAWFALKYHRSVRDDVELFALRARRLAADWMFGILPKIEAVDRAYNFALALGLHYRLAGTVEALRSKDPDDVARALADMSEGKPIDAIQRVLAAFFSVSDQ
jgi:hypothetical protein